MSLTLVSHRGVGIILVSFAALGVGSTSAYAGVTNTIVQVGATSAELLEAGYSQVGTGPFVSERAGECFVNGCFTLVGASGDLALRGFLTFQFNDFVNSPTYYNGLFAVLDIDFSASALTRNLLIQLINAETSVTGVSAMTTAQANNAQGTCPFSEWLNPSLLNSVVLNWQPTPAPATGSGLSQVFVIAWDLDSSDAALVGGQLGLNGAFVVPAPGAIGFVAFGGLFARRRR